MRRLRCSEGTPRRDRARGEDGPQHFPAMGIGLTAWRGGNRRWVWLAAAAVVALLVVGGVVIAVTAGAEETKETASATVAADTGAVTTEVATTGTVEPSTTRTLSFTASGTVESVTVRAGTVVKAGQVLATIDDTDAAEAVDDAETALADAEDALDEASSSSTSTATSSSCIAPAAFALTEPSATASSSSPTPTPTATSASPTKTATTSPTRTATTAPTTTAPAAPQGGGTTGGGATGGGTTGGGQQQQGGTSTCGTTTGGSQQGGGQQSSGDAVLSAQQRVNQAEVTLENARDALEGTTIKAPIAGRILAVSGNVGSQVSSGSTFISLADVYDMQISADFPEADAGALEMTQKGTVELADRAGESFAATVVQVDPVGTSDGTMVRYGVVLSFDEAPEDLLVGQSANVRVTTGSKDSVLRVPSTAVHEVANGTGTVQVDGAAVKVGVGLRGDRYTEITSGITAGQLVTRSW